MAAWWALQSRLRRASPQTSARPHPVHLSRLRRASSKRPRDQTRFATNVSAQLSHSASNVDANQVYRCAVGCRNLAPCQGERHALSRPRRVVRRPALRGMMYQTQEVGRTVGKLGMYAGKQVGKLSSWAGMRGVYDLAHCALLGFCILCELHRLDRRFSVTRTLRGAPSPRLTACKPCNANPIACAPNPCEHPAVARARTQASRQAHMLWYGQAQELII